MIADSSQELVAQIEELRERLKTAEETLRAIRQGEVDAIVVAGPSGDRVFTLEGADHPYRCQVEQMREGTVTLDPDGVILYANAQFAAMMRTGVEDVIGHSIYRFLQPPADAAFSGLFDTGGSGHACGELALAAADGSSIPARVSLSGLRSAGINAVCAIVTDLTEQRRNEAMLREEQLSQLIFNQAAEAIVVIDREGRILRASDSVQRLRPWNVLFQDFDDVFRLSALDPPGEIFDTARLMAGAERNEAPRGVEVELRHAGGDSSTLLLSASPLWDSGRQLLGCVITLTDISGRRRAQEELARQARELERSNSDLRQFAYSASHDLREPLRVLALYSQLLQNKYAGRLDEQANKYIRGAVQAAHRMEALLNDLLTYAQATDMPQSLVTRVDSNAILRRTLSALAASIAESGATVSHDPLPPVRVYEAHLQQLFQNLIGNALKYRAARKPEIHIAVNGRDGMWEFAVSDNGIGIDPQYHDQIFGLFKRLHGSGKYSGNGMGLAICQKIVERYRGRIWVESVSGKGSIFYFTLPGVENDAKTQPGSTRTAFSGR